jgi:GNAT superfamily N-acetyltransferase
LIAVEPVAPEGDLAGYLAIRNAIVPDDVRSVEEERRAFALHPGRRAIWVGLLDGVTVGYAAANPETMEVAGSVVGGVGGGVLPAARRRGVGTALLEVAFAHLRSLGYGAARTWAFEQDPDGLAFLEHRGWVEVSRERRSRRPLDDTLPDRVPVAGVAFAELALDDPSIREVYALDVEVSRDIPGPPFDLGTFERWVELELRRSGRRPPLMVVARDGDTIVGFAHANFPADPPTQAWHSMTGVAASHRGRGVAYGLKLELLHRLRELGCTEAGTSNEARNVPMLRVNEKLGYVRRPDEVQMQGEL